MKNRKRNIIVRWIVAILLILLAAAAIAIQGGYMPTPSVMRKHPAPIPTPAATRDDRWQQAVGYLSSQLPYLHVDPYFKISESDFQQQVAGLAAEIPNLNDEQLIVGMMRIIASIGDGHTRAYPDAEPLNYPSLPLEMRWLGVDLIVIAASPEYEQAIGAKVVQIGGHPIVEVQEAVTSLIAANNEMELLNNSPAYLSMPTLLYGLDLIPQKDRVIFSFESPDGHRFDLELDPNIKEGEVMVSIYEKLGVARPLYEKDRESFYWYEYLPDSNIVYMQYNVCAEDQARPFKEFAEEVFALLDGHAASRLVIDLRFNGGGNEAVLLPFIKAVKDRPSLNASGNLFVIIGRGTYSSALQNAITFQHDTEAILIGEPTGGKPNHYGEVRYFNLPNVGLLVQYSTRYWFNYPGSDPLTLEPDVPAIPTMADLLTGQDPALEIALSHP